MPTQPPTSCDTWRYEGLTDGKPSFRRTITSEKSARFTVEMDQYSIARLTPGATYQFRLTCDLREEGYD